MSWVLYTLTNRSECDNFRRNNTHFLLQLQGYYYTMLVVTGINAVLSVIGLFLVAKFRAPNYQFIAVIKALIIFELFFNLCLFTVKVIHVLLHSNSFYSVPPAAEALAGIFLAIQALTTSFQLMRNWAVVIIAAIRYRSLTKFSPFHTPAHVRMVRAVLIGVVAFSLLLSAPRFFDYQLTYCAPQRLFLELRLGPLHLYGGKTAIVYHTMVLTLVQTAGPLLGVTVLSARIALILRRRRRLRAVLVGVGHSAVDRAYSRMNRVVVIVTFSFVIFEMPVFVSKLFLVLGKVPPQVDLSFAMMANVAVCLDSMVNFVAYVLGSTRFRVCQKLNAGQQLCPALMCWRRKGQIKGSRKDVKKRDGCGGDISELGGSFISEAKERQDILVTQTSDSNCMDFQLNVHDACTRKHLCETHL